MTDIESITQQTVHDAFLLAYRRRVGQGREYSLGQLQDETGIEARTLRSWRETDSMPHLVNFLRLCAQFGPAFTSEVLHVAGLGGVDRIDSQESDAHRCVADLISEAHEISERLRDGVFCHRDRAAVGPQLIALARELEAQGTAMIMSQPGGQAARQ